MSKCLLMFAWEYEGYHSERGTALVRRIRQVAESFNNNGWQVVVIHKDQRNECKEKPYLINIEKNGIKRISIKLDAHIEDFDKSVLLRKLETFYYVTFKGDRSHKWAAKVQEHFDSFGIKPDYILAFYTPRVPLYLGAYYSKKLGVPWIADIQDPLLGGISKAAYQLCVNWSKKTLKSAKSVVHVSPEWAKMDGEIIGRKIETIRHAIPDKISAPLTKPDADFMSAFKDSFNIFYGGSLSANIQSLELLKRVTLAAIAKGAKVHILVAGNMNAFTLFKNEFGDEIVKHLGWLTPEQMNQYIMHCNCTLVVPWSKERIGIPSKFYELCIFPKPIWIIGNDLGAFDTLLAEWKHPKINIDSFEYQMNALEQAIDGDYSKMFTVDKCNSHLLKANEIYNEYIKLMTP